MMNLEIRSYDKNYVPDFIRLNKAWIEKDFVLEENDLYLFSHTEEIILKGGMIYFACYGQKIIACCLIENLGNGIYEIEKLAADEEFKGQGAGTAVLQACIDYGKEKKAKKITLVSNTKLLPALRLYEKLGFVHVPLDQKFFGYSRGNIQYEMNLEK